MDLCQNIEELNKDERGESDANDVHKRIIEENDTKEHDDCSLIDRDPNPD